MTDKTTRTPTKKSQQLEDRQPMALWKRALLVFALVGGIAGVAAGGLTRSSEADRAGADNGTSMVGVQSLSADGSTTVATNSDSPGEEGTLWAPLLAKGGLSFFLAFCVGYALRTFLKATMLLIGVTTLAIFGLHKLGVVGEIDWTVAQNYWDDLSANLGRQFESLKSFVTGSLPSAASGTVGLVAGFRR